jgi:hypothetical protein
VIVFELKISLAHVFSLEFSRIKKKLIPNICIVLGFLPYLSKTTTCPCKCQYGGSWALAQLNCSRQRRRNIDNWGGGQIFIYSCSAQLISFETDCFYSLRTRIYEYLPPQLSIFRRLWFETLASNFICPKCLRKTFRQSIFTE